MTPSMEWLGAVRSHVVAWRADGIPVASEPPHRLVVLAAGDRDVASTRLRALPLLDMLEPSSVHGFRWRPRLLHDLPDVIWIQKRLTTAHLRLAGSAKEGGRTVVYDCDDSGPELDYWARPAEVREILQLADVVTTDTPERSERLGEVAASGRFHVLENEMDYAEAGPRADHGPGSEQGGLRVFWFGYGSSLPCLGPWRDVLQSIDGLRLVLCGPRASEVRRVLGKLEVEVRPWNRETFISSLRSCDVTLLSHFGSRHHEAKSAHKMVASIGHGVPAVVSSTPDHTRVAALAGVRDQALWASGEELREKLEQMKSAEVRRAYVAQARKPVLARYAPGSFAVAVAALLRELVARSAAGAVEAPRP